MRYAKLCPRKVCGTIVKTETATARAVPSQAAPAIAVCICLLQPRPPVNVPVFKKTARCFVRSRSVFSVLPTQSGPAAHLDPLQAWRYVRQTAATRAWLQTLPVQAELLPRGQRVAAAFSGRLQMHLRLTNSRLTGNIYICIDSGAAAPERSTASHQRARLERPPFERVL